MKTFENNFILKCLADMEQILSDPNELNAAIKHFTAGETSNSRYQLDSKITDACSWIDNDKLQLSAAVFEAIARASTLYYEENTGREHEINAANTVFLEKYLPLLTENTNPKNRLDSVRQTIARTKEEKIKRATETSAENPYAFFTPVTAGLVVLAAAAATVALLSRA